MTVTFFGHRDAPLSLEKPLTQAIREQIDRGATLFLVGNHGAFDFIAAKILRNICAEDSRLRYRVVLAYLPKGATSEHPTLYPEGLESVPFRFAIAARNRWMLERADTVIVYAPLVGNARKWKAAALKKGKTVVDMESVSCR